MNPLSFRLALASLLLAFVGAAHSAPFAYISRADGAVGVIDIGTQNIVGVISTGGRPEGVAVRLEGHRGYVANQASGQVHVVDTAARAVTSNIPVASEPSAVVLNPSQTRAYILHPGSGSSSQLTIINTETSGPAGTIVFANRAERLEMSADGTRLFISHPAANFVSVVSTASLTVVASIGTNPAPYGMAHDPNMDRLYVASAGNNTVTVINAANHSAIATIAVPGCTNPRNVAVNPPATRLFVTCQDNNVLASINLATLAVTTVNAGTRPTAVEVTPDGREVYVVNSASGVVSIHQEDNPGFLHGQVNVGGTLTGFGKFIGGPMEVAPSLPGPLSGLWWNPDESGWGIHLTQRRSIVFAAWFTYDPFGAPYWYVASDCAMSADNSSCAGMLYEASGARFFRSPFDPNAVRINTAGSVRIDFTGADSARMTYTVGSRTRTVPIQRQVFEVGATPPPVNYTDLWWNPNESGWGLGITQQFGTMFLAWFVYEDTTRPSWYVASNCTVNSTRNGCIGTLYRTIGPAGPANSSSFDPSQVRLTAVGTIEVSFTDPNNGIINYTVDNVAGWKAITRQLF